MLTADFRLEKILGRDLRLIAGVDEVGRGALAGPVVAAAVILPAQFSLVGVKDSKLISAKKRYQLAAEIKAVAEVAVASASVAEIEEMNILQASLLAMSRAINQLPNLPARVIIDGSFAPRDWQAKAVTKAKADQTSLTVAAASICAKCWRDRFMAELASSFPGYYWQNNVGYGTAQHRAAIRNLGVTVWHRRNFAPVRALINGD